MIELQTATDSYPIWKAIVWCFYPVGALVGAYLTTGQIIPGFV